MRCLVCGNPLELDVAIIGDQYPSAIFLEHVTEKEFGLRKSSLNLSRCLNTSCSLVQLTEPVNLEMVYMHYPYQSGTTATMRSILSSVVDESLSYQSLQTGEVILDIGGNDGTLLSLINRPDCRLINIDAASHIEQEYQISNYTYINTRFEREAYLTLDIPAPKLIFCVAVFYQVIDPLKFLQDVVAIMNNESLLVLQMTYLESMYTNNIFDNVVHEHITYFSLASFTYVAELAGLKVLGARVVESYGGSLRVFLVTTTSSKIIQSLKSTVQNIVALESEKGIERTETLAKFGADFRNWKATLGELLDSQFKRFGPIIGMGASTKGNMILQSLDITEKIMPFILDNNLKKIGSRTTGSFIPIVDEEKTRLTYTNVMSLPYYYDAFFKKKLSSKIESGRYLDFISPLPKPCVTRLFGDRE